ncbi:glutathione S-transferase family protein [Alteromonas sp. a30]|uniref:glutathione S-transferase family protein n=1 Tax=Alteromonas sp. a30 TaxID=2730917 RepID=UPI002282E10D|nr:glutathione S-transferase family protein [Alteromonas sp. a30]MCY7294611.1 glutathione S-transferase family protein [Alteromonas sp. a30]
MFTLYGSTTSPFVRRTRLLLADTDFTFNKINIFNPEDKAELRKVNPTLKIPMLQDGDNYIYDSKVIYRYIAEKLGLPKCSWDQENLLTTIDSANDTFVQLFLLTKSDFDVKSDRLYFNMQQARLDTVLPFLDEQAKTGAFDEWHYPSICLFCMMDWLMFRKFHDFSVYENLMAFHARFKGREDVVATQHED